MARFGKRDLIYLILLGICLLTAAFFGLKASFSEKKYEEYRREVLVRSTEGSIQLLYRYAEEGDGDIAPLLSARLGELPFKEEEREAMLLFCRHVYEGKDSPELEKSARAYAVTLAKQLEADRERVASGDLSTLPTYGGEYIESFFGEDPTLKAARALLFSDSPAKYERTEGNITITCYRTGRGYAEFSGEKLVKYLFEPKNGPDVGTEARITAAKAFAEKYFETPTENMTYEEDQGGTVCFFDGCEITVSLSGSIRRALLTDYVSE